ncbi:MAG: PEP/pyruvate-binding domain-containing protein [Lachnospiraceae bacterium]
MSTFEPILSGLTGLDSMLNNIRLGDNVVWQVSSMKDYMFFVEPFYRQAMKDERKIIYMHFTGHPVLIDTSWNIPVFEFDPSEGFEAFTMNVRKRISAEGRDVFYIFDCLSKLQSAWATDLMMGNFFQVTCPYLFELNTVAYFPILRGRHSFDAIARIQETTQLLLDIYTDEHSLYINPLKVWNRYSPNMFLPHQYISETGSFLPLRGGYEVSRFYTLVDTLTHVYENQNLDSWERFVNDAKHSYHTDRTFTQDTEEQFARNMMSCDEKILSLLKKYFSPEDYFLVYNRMIGTGSIGGKACGMLLSRKIIEKDNPEAFSHMEPHDSYYLGSDVFYTYIVHNKFWRLHINQKTEKGYFKLAPEIEEKFYKGSFPEATRQQFIRMLNYFGQRPIIVRSSSLLEDGFGNAFAGKYESVFCINSGTTEDRLTELENAVRTVYASTMNRSALEYRKERGLGYKDEQMALLIQRVSGSMYEDFLMPNAAGVGYSYSSYRWNDSMDASAGMLRLVMGLGTRAVDRTEGDYPRIVNLAQPNRSTLTDSWAKHQYSQRYVDLMDYNTKSLSTRSVKEITPYMDKWYQRMVLEHDYDAERTFRERGQYREILFASCEGLVRNREFIDCMKSCLRTLQHAYDYPVDIEFTINGSSDGQFVFNLLQCRPLQVGTHRDTVTVPILPEAQTIFSVTDSSMGGSRAELIDYIVWVDSKGYYQCPYKQKPDIARIIGDINHYFRKSDKKLMLFVPGRIGTSSPELGVPVSFAEIHHFCAICEMSDHEVGYMPELSYGSHMFQDLVEAEIFYTAIFGNHKTEYFDKDYFKNEKNILTDILPDCGEYQGIIHIYNLQGKNIRLYSDVRNEKTILGKDMCIQ